METKQKETLPVTAVTGRKTPTAVCFSIVYPPIIKQYFSNQLFGLWGIFISIKPCTNTGLRYLDRINVSHTVEIDLHYQA